MCNIEILKLKVLVSKLSTKLLLPFPVNVLFCNKKQETNVICEEDVNAWKSRLLSSYRHEQIAKN